MRNTPLLDLATSTSTPFGCIVRTQLRISPIAVGVIHRCVETPDGSVPTNVGLMRQFRRWPGPPIRLPSNSIPTFDERLQAVQKTYGNWEYGQFVAARLNKDYNRGSRTRRMPAAHQIRLRK